jgi:chromate transporter
LPFWNQLRSNETSRSVFAGVSASVVGILLAALYVWTSAVLKPADFVVALTALVALAVWKVPPWLVVIAAAAGGVMLSYWS